jgi:hypothetical protein
MKYLHSILTYRRCVALIETYPWYVSDVLVWNALPPASNGSFIYFHITDINKGLEFGTSCESTLPPRTDSTHDWQRCEYENVSFRYQHDSIQIRRSYVDDWYVLATNRYNLILIAPSLGGPPYNGGVFYGSADTRFRVVKSTDVEIWTQAAMEVPATYQVS